MDEKTNKKGLIEDSKKNEGFEISTSESEALGSNPRGENVVGGGGESVIAFVKFDERAEEQVRNLLQKDLKVESQEVKKDFLVIFGLFASFVTFISINVQVFKNNNNALELIGICSLSLSFIVFFALIINGIVKHELEWKDLKKPVYIINLLFLIIGIIFISCSEVENDGVIAKFEQNLKKDSIKIENLNSIINKLEVEIVEKDLSIQKIGKSVDRLDSLLQQQIEINQRINNQRVSTNNSAANKQVIGTRKKYPCPEDDKRIYIKIVQQESNAINE